MPSWGFIEELQKAGVEGGGARGGAQAGCDESLSRLNVWLELTVTLLNEGLVTVATGAGRVSGGGAFMLLSVEQQQQQ